MTGSIFLAFALLAQQTAPAPKVVECQLSVHPVDATGNVGNTPIILPTQVSSVIASTDPVTGMKLWDVKLTPEGAASNLAYTQSHVGGKIAIFCGTRRVQEATIQGASSNEFEVSAPNQSSKRTREKPRAT